MKNEVKNWLDSSLHMYNTGRYIYTVFMCHLALEKLLKARVQEITGETPPKTHDLEYLLGLAKLSPDEDMEKFIVEISNLSVVTRYPSDFQRIFKDFSPKRAELILIKAKEAFQWIKRSIAL
jgi:HEPN domain-containing protein